MTYCRVCVFSTKVCVSVLRPLTCCLFHFFLLSFSITMPLFEKPSSRARGISVASSSGMLSMIVSLLLFTDMS